MLSREIATIDLTSRSGNLLKNKRSARLGESARYTLKLLRR